MYQENLLRTEAVSDDYGAKVLRKTIFAPASDPFETAAVIKRYLEKNNCMKKFANIYICPLSTKAQALGISFLYLREEYLQKNVSVIYPFSTGYSKETSQGIAKIWQYTFEF
jgi:hypothetical protein